MLFIGKTNLYRLIDSASICLHETQENLRESLKVSNYIQVFLLSTLL